MGWRAVTLLLQGRWDEAAELCVQMLARPGISPVNRLNPLRVLGSIRGRRGEPGAWELLDEAVALAEGTGEPPWIAPVRAARAELRWLLGPARPGRSRRSGRPYDRALGHVDPWTFGSLAIWLAAAAGAGRPPAGPAGAIRPGD